MGGVPKEWGRNPPFIDYWWVSPTLRLLIDTWSGKGNFATPVFTVNYDRIKTTATVKTAGRFQYYLFDVNGAKLSGSEMTYQPDKTYPHSMSVKPGKSYYIEITAPADMQWTFKLEETNSPP